MRPEQTPQCRLCLSTFLKDCSGAWSRKLGLKNSQKAGKTFLRGLELTGRPRSCVLGALDTSHQGSRLVPKVLGTPLAPQQLQLGAANKPGWDPASSRQAQGSQPDKAAQRHP